MMKKKILVVGASRDVAKALAARWDVSSTPAGPAALCRAHELKPDLVIAEGDGVHAARTLGWVDGVPSLLLSEPPGPRPGEVPSARLVLDRSCDDETLVRCVDEILPR
jgi:hypothetical protein